MRFTVIKMLHQKCRQGFYSSSNIKRFEVPEDKVSWDIKYPEYKPVKYTSEVLVGKPWADPDIGEASFKPKWNSTDGKKFTLVFIKSSKPNPKIFRSIFSFYKY